MPDLINRKVAIFLDLGTNLDGDEFQELLENLVEEINGHVLQDQDESVRIAAIGIDGGIHQVAEQLKRQEDPRFKGLCL